jgi:hypothetical protein
MQTVAVPIAEKTELLVSSVFVIWHASCSSLFGNFLNIAEHSLTYADKTNTTEHRTPSIIPTSKVHKEVMLVLVKLSFTYISVCNIEHTMESQYICGFQPTDVWVPSDH